MSPLNSQKIPKPDITAYGDSAVLVRYPVSGYSDAVIDAVLSLSAHMQSLGGWSDIVNGYDSLMLCFDPARRSLKSALNITQEAVLRAKASRPPQGRLIDIPVHYGGDNGPDIKTIMQSSGLSQAALIKAHSAPIYRVCMMGFIPGFAFLSQAPKALHHPRLDKPRLSVPAGSVGIAGWQTGIYGLSSPGGWQIIGCTDIAMFDPNRETQFYLTAGDRVRFVATEGMI